MICTNCRQQFKVQAWDKAYYKKQEVPEPTLCPDCRLQRRLIWRNLKSIYKRKCDLCEKEVIGIFSADKQLKVYCRDCYYSDKWDDLEYGQDFDFNKTFTEQYQQLLKKIPHVATYNEDPVNSDYVNFCYRVKNNYLSFGTDETEDCAYCLTSFKCNQTYNSYFASELELSSFCINCCHSYNLHYSQECYDMQDSYYCYDCRNCHHCFGSAGLRNKSYYIYDEKVSEEEWNEKVPEILNDNQTEDLYTDARKNWLKIPRRANTIIKSENSTGDHLTNCKNAFNCYDSNELENCKNVIHCSVPTGKDLMDVNDSGAGVELSYEFIIGYGYHLKFCALCYQGASELEYCYSVFGSKDCFGCASIKKRQYCILNKQYNKEEYYKMREKIIKHMMKTGEWGEFFDKSLSPFNYNETVADDVFPLNKNQIIEQGFKYREPDDIVRGQENTAQNIHKCKTCSRLYKIIKQEIEFASRVSLPLPVECPSCRFQFLLRQRNFYKIWERKCAKCDRDIKTTYSPEQPEIIYCEDCYKKGIY
ncbi:MAG: hypothetical protein V1898_03790 [Patescibacteria group bacterium]